MVKLSHNTKTIGVLSILILLIIYLFFLLHQVSEERAERLAEIIVLVVLCNDEGGVTVRKNDEIVCFKRDAEIRIEIK